MTNLISAKSFFKSIVGFSLSSWCNFFIGVLAVSLTTRLFTPDVMGGLNQFNNASALLIGFCCLGFDNAFIRYYFEPPKNMSVQELFVKCVAPVCILVSVVAFVILPYSAEISYDIFDFDSELLILLIIVNAFSILILDRFFVLRYRMSGDLKGFTVYQVFINLTSKLFVLLAALTVPNINNVCLYNTIGVGLLFIFCITYNNRVFTIKREYINLKGYNVLFRYAITSWPSSIILRFNQFIIPFLIGIYLDSYQVGIYAGALYFCAAFSIFTNGFNVYWSPFMYKNYNNQKVFIKNTHDYVMIFLIFIMLFLVCSQNIAYLLIGEQFHASKSFFAMLLLEPIYSMLMGTTSYGVSIKGKNEELSVIYLVSVLMNIVFIVILINNYGLDGVAVGLGISAMIRTFLTTWRGQKYYSSINSWKKTTVGILILFVIALSNMIIYYNEALLIPIVFIIVFVIWINHKEELILLCNKIFGNFNFYNK